MDLGYVQVFVAYFRRALASHISQFYLHVRYFWAIIFWQINLELEVFFKAKDLQLPCYLPITGGKASWSNPWPYLLRKICEIWYEVNTNFLCWNLNPVRQSHFLPLGTSIIKLKMKKKTLKIVSCDLYVIIILKNILTIRNSSSRY